LGTFRTIIITGLRAVALVGILPGSIVAAAYLLVLTGRLYDHWDARTAIVLGMTAWGMLGVFELWHLYVRLSRNRAAVERTPVSPRALLFLWALILLPIAVWKVDERPWAAAFLALVALYSLARAFGLLRYVARPRAAPARASVSHVSHRARARGGERSRARRSPVPSSGRASS
jgi:hypothetical protein